MKKLRVKLPYLLCLCFITLLPSCRTPYYPPSKEFIKATDRPLTNVNTLTVYVDSCITQDAFKDYINVDTSRKSDTFIMDSIKNYMENIGYSVDSQFSLMTGGFKATDTTFLTKVTKKSKAEELSPPYFVDPSLEDDPDYKNALMNVSKGIIEAMVTVDQTPAEAFSANTKIQADLDILKSKIDTRYTLVVLGNGFSVPGSKTFTQQMLSGVATGVLTGGLLVLAVGDVSTYDTYAAIIDMENNELFWTNKMTLKGGNLAKDKYYSVWNKKRQSYDGWVNTILFYLPVKEEQYIEAVKTGNIDVVEWMIMTGTDVNSTDSEGTPAIHWAIRNKKSKLLKYLAKNGVNFNIVDAKGNTPLHEAAINNKKSVASLLIKNKATVDLKNNEGQTALDIATNNNYKSLRKYLEKQMKK